MVILQPLPEMDWTLLSALSNIFLTGSLVAVTWWYAHQIEKRARMDRSREEMDLLIAPMYAKSRGFFKILFFMKGSPGYIDNSSSRVQQYFQFWDNVQRYKYLGPDYLRAAIDEYIKNKSNDVQDRTCDPEYEIAERQLITKVEQRYQELIDDRDSGGASAIV